MNRVRKLKYLSLDAKNIRDVEAKRRKLVFIFLT